MIHDEFKIGETFHCGGNEWRCTDKGTRTIITIKLEANRDVSWLSGPPYSVFEFVFDEYDIMGCEVK